MNVPLTKPERDRAARAALTYLAAPADPVVGTLLRAFTPMKALQMLAPGENPDLGDLLPGDSLRRAQDRCAERLQHLPTPAQEAAWEHSGIRLICPDDPEWPESLDDLGDARPYALWVRGNADLRFSCTTSVSVVGSRAASAYGSYMASELAADLAGHGCTIISGAAYGVDGAAHQAALAADGTTIAVLACGVDNAYPAGHQDLLTAIAAHGAIVSEYPPGQLPSRLRFLQRNRIIAALSPATLVVEAIERSGSLTTARHARDLHRAVLAVPGPVTSEQSRGCHALIRDHGALLVTSARDALAAITPKDTP
jgi:DNA processing protein